MIPTYSAPIMEKQRLINLLASYGIRNSVLSAFDIIPREAFLENRLGESAYEDRALPIGEGQTVSQPSLVAEMIQALKLQGHEKILEIGTGSGFQTAILSRLVKQIYTVERIKKLADQAKIRLKDLNVKNVTFVMGDGSKGLAKHAPYDAVIVGAAFSKVPKPLVEQLKVGSSLVMPVGAKDWQEVTLYKKVGKGFQETLRMTPAHFVPLIGKYAWPQERLD